ncbi:MAG: hypothetical protein IT551_11865 [Novosphingobium sp.]|nr:hypothetical protein [Novosphingobium sp.]
MTVIKTDRFDAQRNRMADLEAPTPATEQYEYWDESESGTYRLTTGQFLLASVVVIIGAIALVL